MHELGNENNRRAFRTVGFALGAAAILALPACGGGGGGGSDQPQTVTGYFKDANVSGINYTAGDKSGTTDASGRFTFDSGSSVAFSINGVDLGSTSGAEILTPLELSANGSISDTAVQNRARFLLMLDSDGDFANGIQISKAVQELPDDWPQPDFSSNTFESDTEVTTIVSDVSTADSRSATLPTATEAKNHLETTLRCATAGAFKGTYSGDDSGTFGFLVDASNGTVAGVAYSEGDQMLLEITGGQAVSLDSKRSFASGTVSSGANFSGNFDTTSSVSGSWDNSTYGSSGSFSGTRIGGDLDAAFRFTGSYGGSDSGLLSLDIDGDGNVTGVAYSVVEDSLVSISGSLTGTSLSATTDAGDNITGTIDTGAGTASGSWSSSDGSASGTFSGSGCRLN